MDLGKVGKVAKAVETAAPKLEDVAKDAMAWVKHSDARIKNHETNIKNIAKHKDNLDDSEMAYFDNEADEGMGWDMARYDYSSELKKMMRNLEPPRYIKDNITNEISLIDDAAPGDHYANFNIHTQLDDYHNHIAKLHPEEKKLFDHLIETQVDAPKARYSDYNNIDGRMDYAAGLMTHLRKLNPTQQDTFLKLLPEWNGSLDELQVAARTL